jgi:HK97 family phage prohead protease
MTKPLVETGAREQRAVTFDSVEFRRDTKDGKLEFRGHAAVFDEWTEIPSLFGGSFMERIARGAFRKVLSEGADVRFLINHDGLPLARTSSGTMRLKEDAKGLRVDADLADTTLARDLAVLLERRDISQMSFGFRVGKHELEEDEENGTVKRTITEFSDLYDVSPVTFPAYEGTDAAMRAAHAISELASSMRELKEVDEEQVRLLREQLDAMTAEPNDEPTSPAGLTAARANLLILELG